MLALNKTSHKSKRGDKRRAFIKIPCLDWWASRRAKATPKIQLLQAALSIPGAQNAEVFHAGLAAERKKRATTAPLRLRKARLNMTNDSLDGI
jgi:hypothetical protein